MQELQVKKHENVLEIGAGSGYMAALLASKARHVTTIEINPALKQMAQENLANANVTNATVELGNGSEGSTAGAPFDVIMISGALEVLPEVFLKQLKVGGRIAAIVGVAPVMQCVVVTRVAETAWDTVQVFETNVKALASAPQPSESAPSRESGRWQIPSFRARRAAAARVVAILRPRLPTARPVPAP